MDNFCLGGVSIMGDWLAIYMLVGVLLALILFFRGE